MVMHARKQPRLNDGYADRKDVSHLHQNMQYQPKGYGSRPSYGDRYEEETSDRLRGGDDSPDSHNSPRYSYKSSYSDRYKEKRSKGPYEKKGNSLMSVAASIRSGNTSYHTRDRLQPSKYVPSSSTYRDRETTRDSRDYSREANRDINRDTSREYNRESGRSELVRDSSRDSGRSEPKEKDHRTEVQKTATQVRGDWSEHISSSGKGYYYNCKTEVSQWEKPKEWIDSPKTPENSRSKDGRGLSKSYPSTGRSDDRSKHSVGGERYDKNRTSSDSYKTSPDVIFVDKYKENTVSSSHNYQRTNSTSDHYHKDTYSDARKNSYPYSMVDPSRTRNRHNSSDNRLTALSHGHKNNHTSHDDMEISPENTPSCSRGQPTSTHYTSSSGHTSRLATLTMSNTSPVNLNNLIPPTGVGHGRDHEDSIKQKALQTLQKLQAALNLQIERAQNMTQNGPGTTDDNSCSPNLFVDTHRLELPLQLVGGNITLPTVSALAGDPHIKNGGGSPVSELSEQDSCHSPANSTTSSQNVPISTSALSGAGFSKKDQSAELESTFSNYYNEKLIGHVMGWQADLAEREAKRYWQEALTVGSHHCSQVSVELTKARSLVRVAEIESTLHEQRILFLDKQIAEIENLKPPSSILPS